MAVSQSPASPSLPLRAPAHPTHPRGVNAPLPITNPVQRTTSTPPVAGCYIAGQKIPPTRMAFAKSAGYIRRCIQSSTVPDHPGAARMIPIDEAYVDSAAPNADAAKNGRGLVLKNKLSKLHVSDDGSLIFGQCQGSGKDPYQVSVDFARPEQPTHRCSC